MNRYLVTSLVATAAGALLVFAAHGCAIGPFGDYTYEQAQDILSGATSSSGGLGGSGGVGGSGGSGGSSCTCGPADNNPCTDDLTDCPNGDESACHPALATGMPCDSGGQPGTCDADGMCVGCSECADPGCTNRCVGQKCAVPKDCANGNCVDGYCCESACDGPCNACNRVPGSCQPLPVGITSDVAGECTGGQVCGNAATCKMPQNGVLGALCTIDANCESGKCVGQICVSLNGQPCVEDLECGSRLCDPTTHKCIACGGAVPCPGGGSCVAGDACPALLGQPAQMDAECKSGTVPDGLICSLAKDASCANDFECASHDCDLAPNGKCGALCTIDATCPAGTICNKNKGWCLLPPGNYCVINDQCQGPMGTLGKCGGFPPRCQ